MAPQLYCALSRCRPISAFLKKVAEPLRIVALNGSLRLGDSSAGRHTEFLCKHENLSSTPQHSQIKQTRTKRNVVVMPATSALGLGRGWHWSWEPCWLRFAGHQYSFRFGETLSQGSEAEMNECISKQQENLDRGVRTPVLR